MFPDREVQWFLDLPRFSQDEMQSIRSRVVKEMQANRLGIEIEAITTQIAARLEARKAKNWAESDRIRDELAGMGIAIKDNKDGTTSWEVKR